MLTRRQNLQEVMKGGNPDRYVKQYEFMDVCTKDPYELKYPDPVMGGPEVHTGWGVTRYWPVGVPGGFPVHTPESKIVCPDVAEWEKYVKAPETEFPAADWEQGIAQMEAVDREDQYAACFIAPGLFENSHYLMEMQNCMMNFYEEPEAMEECINYLADWELAYTKSITDHMKPDAVFHHDDWGSQISTFLAPSMFEDFYLEPYKKIYGQFKENGVELIVHHSDSYAATLVPYMIDMGIDIWQGVMRTNDIPKMIEEYGPKITMMGGVDSALVDKPGWTKEEVDQVVEDTIVNYGSKKYFIPCQSQGLAVSTFEGVYEAIDDAIDKMTEKMF